jgi:hypothetical protein
MVESVLVMQGLGIQLQTTYWSGLTRHRFIEQGKIKDILINEGFHLCRVIYYLAFIVEAEGQEKIVLPFRVLI